MKYIVIVNGKPGSGKTTFEVNCNHYLDESDLAYGHVHSSIDYIKNIYKQLGWNGVKTDKARKNLSMLKKIWIENCNGPLQHMMDYVLKLDNDSDHVIFVDIREEDEIIKFKEIFDVLSPIGIKCTTVFIDKDDNDGFEYGNKSDDNVGQNMSIYEYVIHNNGSFSDLIALTRTFINGLLKEE